MPLLRVVVLGSQNCSALSDRCTAGLVTHSMITDVAIKPPKLMPVSLSMLLFVHAGLKLTMKRQVDGWQWLEGFRVMSCC